MKHRNTLYLQLSTVIFCAIFVLGISLTASAQGKIAFVSDRDGNDEIYVMDANGSNQMSVTSQVSEDTMPSISPDGTKIVFASDVNGDFNIFIADINGTNRVRLTDSPATDLSPAFSPDGTKIAFSTDRDGVSRIYIINVDGTGLTPASPDTSSAIYPSFSPDGLKILYASNRDGNFEIYRSEISGANQTRLTDDLGFDSQPVYNADGSKICFRSNRDGNDEIYIMNANGTGPVRLTQNTGLDFKPVFSPDGTRIAFTSDRGGTFQIFTMGIDGSNQLPLTSGGGSNSFPSWVDPVLAPPSLTGVSVTTPIQEGDAATLSGNMFSGDPSQALSLSIDWGDGSPIQVFNYSAGTTVFNESHQYLDDPSSLNDNFYQIALTLTTVHGMATGGTPVFVGNAAPQVAVSFPPLTQLGSPTSVNLIVGDAGTLDTHIVNVDWGDNSPPTLLNLGAGVMTTSANHTYAALGRYIISATVTDEDGESSTPTSVYAGIVPPPTIGKIAFTSNLGGNNDIWLMNSNGTGQVALTTNSASDSSPSFSHDGSRIAFASDRDGNSEIYVMNAAGKFQTRLTNNAGFDTTPVFSPDGSKIVFSSNRDGNYEIYIMNSNGTGQTRLTTNTQDDGQPAFSPDGTKIYFARLASNQSDSHIWSMDLNGANQVALTSGSLVLNGQPNVSPNGQKIVFASVRPLSSFTEPEIFIMDANGANQTRLTTATGYDYEPVFSPDGTKIAFRSERNGNAEIYIMDANGANQQRITFDGAPTSNFAPSWAATPMVAVDIPDDLAGEQGSTLTVPITVSDTTGKGILSYDIRLAYDPAVLHLQTVAYDKSGTLSTGFEVNANEETPGVTTISGFGTVPLTGAGTLLKLKFDVIGTPPTSTALTFESFRFNEGIPFADTLGGQAFVQGTIRGTVQYGTSATPVGVPNVSLSATGSPTTSATTAADGTYRLGGFGPGAYIVTPTKTGDNNGISSFDASLISQYMVGLTTFTNNQIFAGDASGDGTLSSFDAALIAQYVVGLPNNSLTGTWHFLPASRSYASVANMADENYTALLIGEVSGNWATSTTSGLSSLMLTNAKSDSGLEQDKPIRKRTTLVTAALPSLKVGVDQSIVVPVTIKFQGEVPAIQAYQFELVYDPLVLQLQSAPLDLAGTLSSGLASVANGQVPGRLRVAVYGARSITDAGTLINLKFRVVGRAGSSSALSFTNLMFNEGNPKSADHGGKISVRK